MHVTDMGLRKFWGNVALPDASGCMLWMAGRFASGYGSFRVGDGPVYAHRLSLFLAAGDPPVDRPQAAHSCRNRHCVAPEHLRWSNQSENEIDKRRDGVDNRGERHPLAKLTEADVRRIRQMAADGGNQRIIGQQFGITQNYVNQICARLRWKHVTD